MSKSRKLLLGIDFRVISMCCSIQYVCVECVLVCSYWSCIYVNEWLLFMETGITGDGRCLFRSVVHGACLRSGQSIPSENVTKELADDLRTKVLYNYIFMF